ncbi:hypothetical protein ACFQO4_10800 [Saliphagus sp. GCM10025334]
MSPNADSEFSQLDEYLDNVDLSSDVSEGGLEVLKDELQDRIDHQENEYQYYLDLGFRSARTVIVLLGIFVSAIAVLINQGMINITDLISAPFLFGGFSAVLSILFGTLLPFFISYFRNRARRETDYESITLAEDPGLVYSKEQILTFAVEQKVRMTKRSHKSVGQAQVLALISQYLFVIFGICVGYGILAAL